MTLVVALSGCAFDASNLRACESHEDCPNEGERCSLWGHCFLPGPEVDPCEWVACELGECCGGLCCEEDAPCCGGLCCEVDAVCCDGVCCGGGASCCDGQCVASERCCAAGVCAENQVCCGTECAESSKCCGNQVRQLATDPEHCGTCYVACGEGIICQNNACICNSPWGTCGAGVCATNLSQDPQHCGLCGAACGINASCREGNCVCAANRATCDGSAGICGVDLLSDPAHCGGCDQACPLGSTCDSGQCRCGNFICAADELCCDQACVAQTVFQCGGCDSACRRGESCVEGRCVCGDTDGSCGAGLECCQGACVVGSSSSCLCGEPPKACTGSLFCCGDGVGECTDVRNNDAHCGNCGVDCAAIEVAGGEVLSCRDGRCVCPLGTSLCGSPGERVCANLETDVRFCGNCGIDCLAPVYHAGVDTTCENGRCNFKCLGSWADCDAGVLGCETDLQSTRDHCGACGTSCAELPNVVPSAVTCAFGQCVLVCAEGWADCDGDPMNGCEAHLATSEEHCGTCNNGCSLPNAAVVRCEKGQCLAAVCAPGTADCDENPFNGCESGAQCQRVVGDDLLALFHFDEGDGQDVFDHAGTLSPAPNLFVADKDGKVRDLWRWQTGGGLEVFATQDNNKNTRVTCAETQALLNAIKGRDAFSLELWTRSRQENLPESFSIGFTKDKGKNGVVIGQKDRSFFVWVRTDHTSTDDKGQLNGGNVFTEANFWRPEHTVHVVLTFDAAEKLAVLYVDGAERQRQALEGNLSNWGTDLRFMLANTGGGDRPWLGTYYLAAVYRRALSPLEVQRNFVVGAAPAP